ncbi:DNA ligase, ATP-dependent, N-terminal [Dillenia turbinata]|uniref:DNA ligase, ATP-dependent, N-terminal n=1 Tax=Dillenia turbinata TaxID=194707 RepID=A0AAN8ZF53_9MAGN
MIAKKSGRIAITEIARNLMRTVIQTTPADLVAFVYLLANRIAPAHEGVELGIKEASIIKALAELSGSKEAHIKNQYKELGNLGLCCKSHSSQTTICRTAPLTVSNVFDTFLLIAKRKLQIGLAKLTLLASLGQAAVTEKNSSPLPHVQSSPEEAAKIVKQVYSVLPVYDKIILSFLVMVYGIFRRCTFMIGVPVGPMLEKPTKGELHVKVIFVADPQQTCSQHLYRSFEEEAGFLQFVTAVTSNDIEEIQKFLETAVDTRTRLPAKSVEPESNNKLLELGPSHPLEEQT